MAKILDFTIDFPDIEGSSYRQEKYAEDLRLQYIADNIDRFKELEETIMICIDKRDIDNMDAYMDDLTNSVYDKLSDEEYCVLFCKSAGYIIGTLVCHSKEKERDYVRT